MASSHLPKGRIREKAGGNSRPVAEPGAAAGLKMAARAAAGLKTATGLFHVPGVSKNVLLNTVSVPDPASIFSPEIPTNKNMLNSWKEIASYLGRGTRTVQRWEAELGLPVHRPHGKERGPVFAFKDALDEWSRCTPTGLLNKNLLHGHPSAPDLAQSLVELAQRTRALAERLAALILDRDMSLEAEQMMEEARSIMRAFTAILESGNGTVKPINKDHGPSSISNRFMAAG
jgi:hypothetical protein